MCWDCCSTTQEAVKLMNGDGGSIINISSIVGPMPVGDRIRLQRDQSGGGRDYRLHSPRNSVPERSA